MDIDVNVTQMTIPEDRPSVFKMHVPAARASQRTFEIIHAAWDQAWKRAGAEPVPTLLILPDDMELTALTDVELHNVGLMRIPEIIRHEH